MLRTSQQTKRKLEARNNKTDMDGSYKGKGQLPESWDEKQPETNKQKISRHFYIITSHRNIKYRKRLLKLF